MAEVLDDHQNWAHKIDKNRQALEIGQLNLKKFVLWREKQVLCGDVYLVLFEHPVVLIEPLVPRARPELVVVPVVLFIEGILAGQTVYNVADELVDGCVFEDGYCDHGVFLL